MVAKKSLSFKDDFRAGYEGTDTFSQIVSGIFSFFVSFFTLIGAFFNGSSIKSISLKKERKELIALHKECKTLYEKSAFAKTDINTFAANVVIEASEMADIERSVNLLFPFYELTLELMNIEGIWKPLTIDWTAEWTIEQEVNIRRYLRQQKRIFEREDYYIEIWRTKLLYIYAGIIGYIPPGFASSSDEDDDGQSFSIDLIDTMDDPAEVIERLIATYAGNDLEQAGLCRSIFEKFDTNIMRVSGIDPDGRYGADRKAIFPTDMKGQSAQELTDLYLAGTPFIEFFRYQYTISLPEEVRFEHTHIVGGTGHGKTQLLQHLIEGDLGRAIAGECGLCVIDSQGDLIRKLSHLQYFNPDLEGSLADKFLLIDIK